MLNRLPYVQRLVTVMRYKRSWCLALAHSARGKLLQYLRCCDHTGGRLLGLIAVNRSLMRVGLCSLLPVLLHDRLR